MAATAALILSLAAGFGADQALEKSGVQKEDTTAVLFDVRIIELPDAIARNLPVLNLQQPMQEDANHGGRLKFGVVTNVIGVQRHEQFVQALQDSNAARLIGAPRINARSKQKASVAVTREFRYPTDWTAPTEPNKNWTPKAFATRNLGISIEAEAQVNEDNTIKVELAARAVALLGFIDRATKKPLLDWKPGPAGSALGWAGEEPVGLRELALPVFEVQQAAASVKIHSGQTVLLILSPAEETAPFTSAYAGKTLIALITARRAAPAGTPEGAADEATVAGQVKADGIPFALPVQGKPGFVRSPHVPYDSLIDVRGFPAGTELQDPYSRKVFRVP
jgi:hypothetical protein